MACCPERKRAQEEGWFIYDALRETWVFTDGPMRRMSTKAAYFASERGGENHTGEPFSWDCCPWCGADLSTPTFENKWDTGDGPE